MERSSLWKSRLFQAICILALCASLATLAVLIGSIFSTGWSSLNIDFLMNYPSRFAGQAGIRAALVGTLWIIVLTALISIPLGIATAIFLQEFAKNNFVTKFLWINIGNLAGIPSIIYGMLGLALFVRALSLGRSLLSGSLTMALLILPVIIMATAEALRAVPESIRLGAYGVGATKRQVVWYHVLPQAMPGILTGIILALSRALGESAPLILVGALSFVAFTPTNLLDSFTVLPIQIYNWASRPQTEFHQIAASAIVVLLVITLGMNAVALIIRAKLSRGGGR